MPSYEFMTHEGNLYRYPVGSLKGVLLRENFAKHHLRIESTRDFLACLRAGEFAFPGGYRLAFITDDSELICYSCIRENIYSVIHSIRYGLSDGWRVYALTFTDEDICPVYCGHCSSCLNETEEE